MTAEPIPRKRLARRYVDTTPINAMTSPNAVNAHRSPPANQSSGCTITTCPMAAALCPAMSMLPVRNRLSAPRM